MASATHLSCFTNGKNEAEQGNSSKRGKMRIQFKVRQNQLKTRQPEQDCEWRDE